GRVFGQHRRMQRYLVVGAIQRLAAAVGFQVDGVARANERGDIGNRVVHEVSVALAGYVQRLVQVHGAGRIDGDERDVAAVLVRQSRVGGRLRRSGQNVVGERLRQIHLAPDA